MSQKGGFIINTQLSALSQASSISQLKINVSKKAQTTSAFTDDFNTVLNGQLNEDDKAIYNELKAAGVDVKGHSLKELKQGLTSLGFPPITAPAKVKQAWNKALEGLSLDQKQQIEHDAMVMWTRMKSQSPSLASNMNSTSFSYNDLATQMESLVSSLNCANSALFKNVLVNYKANLES